MKKVLFIVMALMLLCSVSVFAGFNVKVGMDFAGKYTEKNEIADTSLDIESDFTLAGEYLLSYKENIDLGVGLAYQMERKFNGGSIDAFNFIPLYGLVRYNMDKVYLVGQLGYNFYNISDEYKTVLELLNGVEVSTKGGLYYGFGAGTNLTENVFGEVLYSVNSGGYTAEGLEDLDISNSQVSVMLGYSF